MKQWQRAPRSSRVASTLALVLPVFLVDSLQASPAHAQPSCRPGHAVSFRIELDPPEAVARQRLQQRLEAELRARDLDVCQPERAEQELAQVHVAAPAPELSPAQIKIHTASGLALERSLDVAALPLEARPSAVASATDELLSALLQSAPATAVNTTPAAPQPAASDAAGSDLAADEGAGDEAAAAKEWRLPYFELGLGGEIARFRSEGKAYGAEALVRWRPLSRLSATLRAGADRAQAPRRLFPGEDTFDPVPTQSSGWHVGLDAGVELLEPAEGVGLSVQGGFSLARLRRQVAWQIATPVGAGRQLVSEGSSWEVAANAGAELAYRTGPLGLALGLAVLVPLSTKEPLPDPGGLVLTSPDSVPQQWDVSQTAVQTPGTGFGERLGAELSLRLWIAVGS